ncbi:3-oxoacyl-[acyl-carrier-protein] reductase [candidate division TA06 bacterium]|nr:3-oxoacyl-[acyl-carrier-protein] reductase [candidate division TA06 bacterium]
MKLSGCVSLITGGARGIGKEIALTFAREGSDVAITDLNLEGAEKTKQEVERLGRKGIALKVDVSRFDDVTSVIKKVLDEFSKIDILVNNAGITRDQLLIRMREPDWDRVMATNLKGVFNFTRSVAREMIKNRKGRIINIASVVGITGNIGQSNYAASKGGVIIFTKSVSQELASRGITVNTIAPGLIDTEMTREFTETLRESLLKRIPLQRMGHPEDVAKVALFLAGEESSYITGQVIHVDGGMVM